MKVCKSCEAVVPEHLDACPHCQCDGAFCLQKRVMALSAVAMLGLTGCPDEDTGPGPEPEYGVAMTDTDTDTP